MNSTAFWHTLFKFLNNVECCIGAIDLAGCLSANAYCSAKFLFPFYFFVYSILDPNDNMTLMITAIRAWKVLYSMANTINKTMKEHSKMVYPSKSCLLLRNGNPTECIVKYDWIFIIAISSSGSIWNKEYIYLRISWLKSYKRVIQALNSNIHWLDNWIYTTFKNRWIPNSMRFKRRFKMMKLLMHRMSCLRIVFRLAILYVRLNTFAICTVNEIEWIWLHNKMQKRKHKSFNYFRLLWMEECEQLQGNKFENFTRLCWRFRSHFIPFQLCPKLISSKMNLKWRLPFVVVLFVKWVFFFTFTEFVFFSIHIWTNISGCKSFFYAKRIHSKSCHPNASGLS